MMALTFTRMVDLFQNKAISKGFIIFFDQEKNEYSDTFQLWCRKLSDLGPEEFKRGMVNLEKKAEDDYRLGREMWPPSYAEFRALAFPNTNRDSLAHKRFVAQIAIEDQTEKAKRYQEGVKQTSALLAMFEEDEPERDNTEQAERGRKALELAKQRLIKGE